MTKLDVELAASRKLGRKLQQLLWKEMPHFESNGFEFAIAYVLLLRAERTHASIRTLARLRFVDDAFALVRVMVEKTINAEYILLKGADVALDYIQFHAYNEWRQLEVLQKESPELAPAYTVAHLEKLRSAHDRAKTKLQPDGTIKQRYGRGHDWLEMGVSKRAEAIDEELRLRISRKSFKATKLLFQSTYNKGAAYLHGEWVSIARSLKLDGGNGALSSEETAEVRIGIRIKDREPRIAADALSAANLIAMSTILFIGLVFHKNSYLKWVDAFKRSHLADLKNLRESHNKRLQNG